MRFIVPVALGTLAAATVAIRVPHDWWMALAWAFLCVSVSLSIVDVLVWQTVKGLDDYATRFQGPSSALETVLTRVWERKKTALLLFLVNFIGRAFSAAIMGAITTRKLAAAAHPWAFSLAIGLCIFSIPILAQQIFSYFRVGRELGQQMLLARREAERAEELKRAAERPSPMTATDEHTAGYTKVVPWNNS